ncbi:MAG: hypothetical protein AAGE84_09530 [Cyanobacteria bacterium P01_G01_bin.39]
MSESILLLPQLKENSDVKSGSPPGEWNVQGNKTFGDVASSLRYESPGAVKNISSVPTMWARPLTLEMVLYDQGHSLREQMIQEWQGMLAAIALAETRGFPLTAQLIELGRLQATEIFARSLYELLPNYQGRNLYTLDNKHPWEDVYVFLWHKKPVGMTSPSTIVVPSEEGIWADLPWWNESEQRLRSPISYLEKTEQGLLWCWLENLKRTLGDHNGDRRAINIMNGLLGDFQASLTRPAELTLTKSDNPVFFEVPLNRGVLEALNYPVKAPAIESSVQLVPSPEKLGNHKPLLIYDPAMDRVWNEKPQNIWIHRGKNLASLKQGELAELKEQWQEVILATPDDLFLPELKFIDLENALPGALLPEVNEPLVFNGQRITPLIPLNSLLLDYLTPEALLRKIKFQNVKTADGIKVRVILDLPLSGVKEDQAYENYRLFKDYDLKEENSLGDQLPVLQVWPHFRTENWQQYYVFYYDGELAEQTFQVTCPEATYAHRFQEGFGTFQMYRLENFPEYLPCTDFNHNQVGLILCEPAPKIRPSKRWHVGVDFGTSFTNVYINSNQVPQPLNIKNLQLQVTNPPRETRINTLFENFIPKNFIPEDKPLPLSSVLTTRGKNTNNKKMLPILDGRIYNADNFTFRPQEEHIKTNLKWSLNNRLDNEVFLKHLALHISALAASEGVQEIEWSLSYPSAFSRGDIRNYGLVWSNLTKELVNSTGIKHNIPDINSDNFRTESLSIAQYFADFENRDLVYSTCIDMGGGTSDISIWDNNSLVHQCSVQLAGRDIFSQFLKLNPKFAEQKFGLNSKDWKGLGEGAFNARLDVYLRFESENWLADQRPLLQEDEDFLGLIQLTTIGFAGLYYYLGILLRVLWAEGRYERKQITPVYLGGNASRFINWLDPTGQFDHHAEVNELLSRMLSKASGFEDTEETTILSENPKDEAACGLVMSDTRLKGLGKKFKDPIIAGEAYQINGIEFDSNSKLEFINPENNQEIESIKEFKIPQLEELPKFLYEYHQAIRELELESIIPLQGYTRSKDTSANQKLWQSTHRELEKILHPIKGDSKEVRPESTFIYGLKALLKVLGDRWVKK